MTYLQKLDTVKNGLKSFNKLLENSKYKYQQEHYFLLRGYLGDRISITDYGKKEHIKAINHIIDFLYEEKRINLSDKYRLKSAFKIAMFDDIEFWKILLSLTD